MISCLIRTIPFFFRLASNALTDVGSVGLKKKRKLKKITSSLGIGGPGTPGVTLKVNIHILGLTKCTIYCNKKKFLFCFLFFSMLLLCSCFRLKELFQVKNSLTTSLLAKTWVGRTTLNGEKRRMAYAFYKIH